MDATLVKVQAAFAAAFDVAPSSITIDTKPGEVPAWDSMGHIALVSSLERLLGLSFDVDDVMAMEDVRQILRIIESKRSPAPVCK